MNPFDRWCRSAKDFKNRGDCVSPATPNRNVHPLREAASARSPFSPQWYESSSGELRQIETIKRLIWDAPALCVAPTGTERQRWRECAPRNNTTGQCKHRRGKPTMRLDPERSPPGLLRASLPVAHTPSPIPRPSHRAACARACALIGPGRRADAGWSWPRIRSWNCIKRPNESVK